MIIRKASAKDRAGTLKLIRQHPDTLLQHNLPRISEFFLAVEGKNIVGCCALDVYSKRLAEVRSLAVAKEFQGKGIATQLIEACLREAKKKRVYEVLAITAAPSLLERHGFAAFNKEKFALFKILKH